MKMKQAASPGFERGREIKSEMGPDVQSNHILSNEKKKILR
jgi:hypothetical protein